MATATRTDIHRPSAINPADYEFVALEYAPEEDSDPLTAVFLAENRKAIARHIESTGGRWSGHAHGGNCHVCGAHCIYTACFYHPATNTYIRTGFDCAEKMDMGDPESFRAFRAAIDDARQLKAGKHKARAVLADAGLSRAWELSEMDVEALRVIGAIERRKWAQAGDDWLEERQYTDCQTREYSALVDIVGRLVRYGNVSDKQLAYLRRLVDEIDNRAARTAERDAKRAAEHAAAAPAPSGRVEFTGKPLSIKRELTQFGMQSKWLLVTETGWKTWGTIPAAIESELWERGLIRPGHEHDDPPRIDRDTPFSVQLTATVTPSRDDAKFSFYSRPSKAQLLV